MPYDNRRPDRVAEAIREEVATFLADGVKDPRVRGLVTVTGVDVTRDLRHAKVYVSVLGESAEIHETMTALGDISTFLRGHVGRALRLRAAPELQFLRDESVARAARIETLFEQIRQDEARLAAEREGDASDDAASDHGASDDPVDEAADDGAGDRADRSA